MTAFKVNSFLFSKTPSPTVFLLGFLPTFVTFRLHIHLSQPILSLNNEEDDYKLLCYKRSSIGGEMTLYLHHDSQIHSACGTKYNLRISLYICILRGKYKVVIGQSQTGVFIRWRQVMIYVYSIKTKQI